ncbi:MAG TPA: hypothetical protein VJ770_17640 [Stellaceae bacterium]|nr:hypothetical protein [Stellaceae bacterium]
MARPPLTSGTIVESLNEIRGLLQEFNGGEESAPAMESALAADEPCKIEPDASSGDAIAPPDPIPAAMPQAAAPSRRATAAALAVVGLAVLGAAGLVSAGRLGLPLLAVSAAGEGQAGAGNESKTMARAALPPARDIAVAKGEVVSKPPSGIGHKAPQNIGDRSWLPPPAVGAGTATPVIALGAGDRLEKKRRGRAGHVAAVEHGSGVVAAFASMPAVTRKADLARVAEETSRQPREVRPGAPVPRRRLPRPAPENSVLTERASKFINSYWEQSSASGDVALRYLSSIYAPVVNYYSQQRTRDSVLQDKHAFLRRWPIRQTWPAFEAENPTISCDRARAECAITGLRDFAVESPKRGARSTGVVRYSYKVRLADGTAQIVAESSKVVAAGAIAISSPAAFPPPRSNGDLKKI